MRLLAADIHLSAAAPARCESFLATLTSARGAQEIYLLGDIFDAWFGDDANDNVTAAVVGAIAATVRSGTAVFIMRGNRDFLLGRRFCRQTGCRLLSDFHVIEADGRRFLLTHGDLLCADPAYLLWRRIAHNPFFGAVVCGLPLAWRRWMGRRMREQSQKRRKKAVIDLPKATAAMQKYNCQTLIHGHTHAGDEQSWEQDGKQFFRMCLPDWEDGDGGFCVLDEDGGLRFTAKVKLE